MLRAGVTFINKQRVKLKHTVFSATEQEMLPHYRITHCCQCFEEISVSTYLLAGVPILYHPSGIPFVEI